MKISIVIPTRNRSQYLKYCLRSCLQTRDSDIEVIVSNNNSVDDTACILSSITDPRLIWFDTEKDLSMRQNFEFALSKTTGDYVIFIGDDDGIIPNGIVTLRHLIATRHPDIILWRHITYLWPDPDAGMGEGLLKFRYRDFNGPAYQLDPTKIYADFCSAKLTVYRDAANIYHGCVSRDVIEKIKGNGGEYFLGQSPDINTAISNLTVSNSIIWVRNPISIAGASPKSNGTAMSGSKKITTEQAKISENFTTLALHDHIAPELDLRIRSIAAATYANVKRVNDTLDINQQQPINHEAWRNASIKDMQALPFDLRTWSLLEKFFREMDPGYEIKRLADTDTPPITTAGSNDRKSSVKKPNLVPAQYTKNVAAVVEFLQKVTGRPHLPKKSISVAFAWQLLKSICMRKALKSIKKQPI